MILFAFVRSVVTLIKLFSLPRFFYKTKNINCSLESVHQQYSEGMLKCVEGVQKPTPRAFLAGAKTSLPLLVALFLPWSEVPPLPCPDALRDSPAWSCRALVGPFSRQLRLRTRIKESLCSSGPLPCHRQCLATLWPDESSDGHSITVSRKLA